MSQALFRKKLIFIGPACRTILCCRLRKSRSNEPCEWLLWPSRRTRTCLTKTGGSGSKTGNCGKRIGNSERMLASRLKLLLESRMRRIVFFVGAVRLQRPVRGAESASDFNLYRQRSRVCHFYFPGTCLCPPVQEQFSKRQTRDRLQLLGQRPQHSRQQLEHRRFDGYL